MVGIGAGALLACLTFYLVMSKFEAPMWGAILGAIIVWGICAFTGLIGTIFMAIALGVMFKADI